jgi:cell division protein FtsB
MRGSARLTSFLGSRHNHVLPRKLLAAGTGLAVLYLVLLTGQRALEAYRVNQEVDAVRRDIEAQRSRNIQLQAELSSARLDEDIERIARDELNMVKPGDQPVVLVWPDGNGRLGTQPAANRPAPEAGWRTWLRLFFD